MGSKYEYKPFRFWCQKTLPLVYDDSLSYYELLCKVVNYLNEMGNDVSELEKIVEELKNWSENLDLQDEVNKKLDQMAEDGILAEIIAGLDVNGVKITYLRSIGTQNCAVIQYHDFNILCDTGDIDNVNSHIEQLKNLGVNKITHIYISHYHYDHCGALKAIAEAIDCNGANIYLPQTPNFNVAPSSVLTYYNLVQDAINTYNMISSIPNSATKVTLNKLILSFYNTVHTAYYTSDNFDYNNCCLVLRVDFGSSSAVFNADIGMKAQQSMTLEVKNANVVSIPHHAIDGWYYKELFMAYSPRAFVVENGTGDNGKDSIYLFSRSKVQMFAEENGILTYPTSTNGQVTIYLSLMDYYPVGASFISRNHLIGYPSLFASTQWNTSRTSYDITVLDVLRGMAHGSFLTARINPDMNFWKLIENVTASTTNRCSILITKNGGASLTGIVDPSGLIIIIPETGRDELGIFVATWYCPEDYSRVSLTVRTINPHFKDKFVKPKNSNNFVSASYNSGYISNTGNTFKISDVSGLILSTTVNFQNGDSETHSIEVSIGSEKITKTVPANGFIEIYAEEYITSGGSLTVKCDGGNLPANSSVWVYIDSQTNTQKGFDFTDVTMNAPYFFNSYPFH